jgi:FlaA1/EpsC-like NDP-sugar epimerase
MPPHQRKILARRLLLFGLDGLILGLGFWAAFAIRVGMVSSPWLSANLYLLPVAITIGLSVLIASGWYRGLTRYSGSHSLYGVLPTTALIVLLLLLVSTISARPLPPFRTFWILYWLLLSAGLIGSRIALRDLLQLWLSGRRDAVQQETAAARSMGTSMETTPARLPTLVYGAGEAAHRLLSELRFKPRFQLIAVVDDDPALWGRRLGPLPIRPPSELPQLIQRHSIRQVLLAMPSASRTRRRALVAEIRGMGPRVLSLPSLAQIALGEHAVTELRPVQIEDLLGREPSYADPRLLGAAVTGKAVLVTGAGGSIGSELCRQIVRLGVSRLVLLERNEYALYTVDQELRQLAGRESGSRPELLTVLGDAAHQDRMEDLCRRHRIQVIFHAAAYKHVPLVESNPCAGVANNVFSTRSTLNAAIVTGVERFLLVSTDKAVRPTNAMGASKRVCELLVQDAAERLASVGDGLPVVAMVRFGNVLGSSGSVVPRFRDQIAAGGPVTITHPEITRYFMTIPEAVQLVLQATGMARGGEVFVLDMGEPVRILDLARQMIQLSGSTVRDEDNPDGEIPILYTGLRPGEKLFEELLISKNDEPTSHPLIRKAREISLDADRLADLLKRLELTCGNWDDEGTVAVLRQLVAGYRPEPAAMSPAGLPTGDRRREGGG